MKLHRLHPDDAYSWQLYPAFEARVRAFLHEYCPDFGNEAEFFAELRQRWTVTPQLAGYWIAVDGETVVAHVCGWIQQNYSRPYVLCFQVECDQIWESKGVLRQVFAEAREWVRELNAKLAEKPDQRLIDYVEQWTPHEPKNWQRFLPELKQRVTLHVMRFSI